MASDYMRAKSPFFWLRVKSPKGDWISINSGVRHDDADARRKIKQLVAEHTAAEARSSAPGLLRFDAWVPVFLRSHYEHKVTLRRALNCWAALSVFWADEGVFYPSQVSHSHGRAYVDWRQKGCGGVKPRKRNTALFELKVMSVILHEAMKRGWIIANPLLRLGIKREAPRRKPEIMQDEVVVIERGLAVEPAWMRDCWLVAMRQGCRLREVAVPMGDVDFETDTLVFRVKGGRLHTAPLHADVRKIALRRRGERFLVDLPEQPTAHWRRFFKRCGLAHLSFHSTRVTVVTRLARSGASMTQAMAYVGHASELVHRVYQRLRPSDVSSLGACLGGESRG